jgi:hypothetical protein
MALPLNNTPIYSLTIPSTKESVKFRPFLVKEQKALLIAQQSENVQVMMDTLKNIIKSSITSKLDLDSLSLFDIEYIFLQLRAKSVGEEIDLILKCPEEHGSEESNKKASVNVKVSIDDIKIEQSTEHTNKISLYNDVGVVMKYPSLETLSKFENVKANDPSLVFEVIAESMDYIYDNEQVYPIKEQSKTEVKEFIDNLTSEQFERLQKFFETMPKLTHTLSFNCPVCTKHNSVKLEGLDSFF